MGLVAKKKTDKGATVEDETGGGGAAGNGFDVASMIQHGVAAEMERLRLHTLQVTADGKKAIPTSEVPVGTPRRGTNPKA